MQYGSSAHHAKHQLRPVASEDYEVRESRFEQMPNRLLDPPPYSRFEQMPNRLLDPPPYADSYPPPYADSYPSYPPPYADSYPPPYADSYMKSYSFDECRPETQNKVAVNKVAVVDNRHAKYKVYEEEEDVNTEADDFIKHVRKKFQLRQKTMSIFG
ncbi:hypothetical protein RHGRI_033376 [Rhododendron griersonianum]|uniref:Uncharacterized protein n=1 Tax=Rhododendron griersonianum TaxID=479676 RepID=A0AAV6HXF1_9ERIC|nr:hypothetical protein RHGRI_033376 [Rhododendron griersonianum]